jgi:DNA-binding transcriptional LysR family regulator
VTLAFVGEGDERPDDLRDGRVDLDIGVLGPQAPELRTQALYRDRFVCVVRRGHPLARGKRTAARVAKHDHIGVSRRGRFHGPIDAALRARGLSRNVVATVATTTAAAIAVASSEWVTALPRVLAEHYAEALPLAWFEFPFELPTVAVAQTWHPRLDRDPVHRLARECLVALTRGR